MPLQDKGCINCLAAVVRVGQTRRRDVNSVTANTGQRGEGGCSIGKIFFLFFRCKVPFYVVQAGPEFLASKGLSSSVSRIFEMASVHLRG